MYLHIRLFMADGTGDQIGFPFFTIHSDNLLQFRIWDRINCTWLFVKCANQSLGILPSHYITKMLFSTATWTIFLPLLHIIIVQLHGHGGDGMQLNRAVSMRLMELLSEKNMTQYQLSTKSGLPRSTVSNIINCTYPSMKLRIVHELCQGLEIGINAFFDSPLFDEANLEP